MGRYEQRDKMKLEAAMISVGSIRTEAVLDLHGENVEIEFITEFDTESNKPTGKRLVLINMTLVDDDDEVVEIASDKFKVGRVIRFDKKNK